MPEGYKRLFNKLYELEKDNQTALDLGRAMALLSSMAEALEIASHDYIDFSYAPSNISKIAAKALELFQEWK